MFTFPSFTSIIIGILYQFFGYGGFNNLHTPNDWVFAILHILFWWAFFFCNHILLFVIALIIVFVIIGILIAMFGINTFRISAKIKANRKKVIEQMKD